MPLAVPQLRFYSLWAINGPLAQTRLRRQMDQLRNAGLDGVVFHPRFYPGDPPYLSPRYLAELSDLILHAKATQTDFWIYDENGWPSGTANGMLLEQHPECAAQRLELSPQPRADALALCWVSPEGHVVKEGTGDAQRWYLVPRRLRALDCLDADACRHFLSLIHERYRMGLKPEAFDYVSTFFTDEPEFGLGLSWDEIPAHGAVPWSRRMLAVLREHFGADFARLLPGLFFKAPGCAEFRVAFWELATDLICAGYFQPYDAWCRAAGKRFTGHIKGEEHPLFQVPMAGSSSRVLQCIGLPGVDALERFPGNHFYPRQAVSVAQQFGDGRAMVECFGGAGWGATPEDLERYLLWLGRHGMTDFVLHLAQYHLNSAAICDWPPSQPLHVSWREAYPQVLQRVRQAFAGPAAPADTLIISPHRGIMAAYEPWELLQINIHNAATYPDSPAARINTAFLELVERNHQAGGAYHFTDERTFEERAQQNADGLMLGKCHYRRVIVSRGAILSERAQAIVDSVSQTASGTAINVKASLPTPDEISAIHNRQAAVRIMPQWQLAPITINLFLLPTHSTARDAFTAIFEASAEAAAVSETLNLEIIFADRVEQVFLNGGSLSMSALEDGTRVRVPRLQERNELHFRAGPTILTPFVWLRGAFRVLSGSSFETGPAGTIKTAGPLAIHAPAPILPQDIVQQGFPFLSEPIIARTKFNCPSAVAHLRLEDLAADAAHLTINGAPIGWTWGPHWELAFPAALPPGTHTVEIHLIPSTFNTYGPHHYFAGDHHVISPDQFRGVKNFIEAAAAPAATHTSFWHFKPLRLPGILSLS